VWENDGGGDVQRTTPGTSGSVGERRDGRRVAAVDDDGSSGGGGRGGGIILILWLAALWGGGPNDKNLSPTIRPRIVFLCTKSQKLLETCVLSFFFRPAFDPGGFARPLSTRGSRQNKRANTWNEKIVSSLEITLDFIISLLLSAPER
jgi:hypothetical protein